MVKQFEIWSSWVDPEDEVWQEVISETKALNPEYWRQRGTIADLEIVTELNDSYLDDEKRNLDIQLEHPILVFADLGLWSGRQNGYGIIESGNIRDIFQFQVRDPSEVRWYCDGHDICCDEVHHDGTNHYKYREMMEEGKIRHLLDMRELPGAGRQIWMYTRSIAGDVAKVYGLTLEEDAV